MPHAPSLRDASPGELISRVFRDLNTVLAAEVELAKLELVEASKKAAARLAILVAGVAVGLLAAGMLSATIVVVLGFVIGQLWIRLLLMAALLTALSGVLVRRGILQLRETELAPVQAIEEAEQTVAALQSVKESDEHV